MKNTHEQVEHYRYTCFYYDLKKFYCNNPLIVLINSLLNLYKPYQILYAPTDISLFYLYYLLKFVFFSVFELRYILIGINDSNLLDFFMVFFCESDKFLLSKALGDISSLNGLNV